MAVAWSKSKVGSAEADVIVRDPVVVTATLPRFLDLGDRSQVHVDFDNVEGEAGDYRLDLDIHGPLTADADALSRTVKLAAHQRASLAVPIAAAGVGTATVDLKLTGPGLSLTQRFPLGISAGAPDVYRRVIKPLAAERARRSPTTWSPISFPAPVRSRSPLRPSARSMRRRCCRRSIAILTAARSRSSAAPCRCSTSTRSPRSSISRVDGDVDARVKQAIDREMTRQSANGAFGLWTADADSDDLWLDAFVDRLPHPRARERLSPCRRPASTSRSTTCAIRSINAADPGEGAGEPLAYALYVLARNGRPVIGDLRYLADAKQAVFKTPLAKAQIAAALAMLGDRARAGKGFAAALDALEAEQDNGLSRPDYGSTLRDAAATLALVVEADMTSAELPGDPIARVGAVLERARAARVSTSTQENDWMVLAAEALAEQKALSQFTVDGQPVEGAIYRKWSGFALGQKLITIANAGKATAAAGHDRLRRADRA